MPKNNPYFSIFGMKGVNGVKGKITRIIYLNEDFLIAKLLLNERKSEITIIGSIYGVDIGEEISVTGEWSEHPKYGKQLQVERWERPVPKTEEQVEQFLASKLIKGCGKKQAKEIVKRYGANAIKVIEREGESCLLDIWGIGKKRAKQIVESIQATFEIQNIMIQLQKYGITPNMIMRAYKEFKSNTAEVILNNPYELMQLKLVGFQRADEIARRIGIMPNSKYRMEACIDHVLRENCSKSGHCYLLEDEVIKATQLALNHNVETDDKVTTQEVEQTLGQMEIGKRVAIEGGAVYPTYLHKSEVRVAQRLSRKMRGSRGGEAMPSVEKAIREYQKREGLVLAEGQRDAIRKILKENILILTGGPGTGKTTSVKAVIDVYKQHYRRHEIGLAAPTGRASRKLAELTGMEASTIHRMIGMRPDEPEPVFNEHNPLPYDLVIVDEMSMVDIRIADLFLSAVSDKTKLLFVGDTDQLPSVGPGNVLRDMLQAGIPHVRLTEIFRQAQKSQIVTNAHRINQGKRILADPEKNDFFFIGREEPEAIAETIRRSVLRFLEKGYTKEDLLVLTPMRRGVIGTVELNSLLQEALNPPSLDKKEVKRGKIIFREGDKVIQNINNYEKDVFNGDIGIVERIATEVDEETDYKHTVTYCRINDEIVPYVDQEIQQIELAYAITVHKSQGGQAPIVIMPVSTSHYIMLARNLIYTGITRAEKKVVLVGTKKALNIAVRNNKIAKRNTKLTERIVTYIGRTEKVGEQMQHIL